MSPGTSHPQQPAGRNRSDRNPPQGGQTKGLDPAPQRQHPESTRTAIWVPCRSCNFSPHPPKSVTERRPPEHNCATLAGRCVAQPGGALALPGVTRRWHLSKRPLATHWPHGASTPQALEAGRSRRPIRHSRRPWSCRSWMPSGLRLSCPGSRSDGGRGRSLPGRAPPPAALVVPPRHGFRFSGRVFRAGPCFPGKRLWQRSWRVPVRSGSGLPPPRIARPVGSGLVPGALAGPPSDSCLWQGRQLSLCVGSSCSQGFASPLEQRRPNSCGIDLNGTASRKRMLLSALPRKLLLMQNGAGKRR